MNGRFIRVLCALQVLMYAEMRGNNQGLIKLVSGALKPSPAATAIVESSNKKISAKVGTCNARDRDSCMVDSVVRVYTLIVLYCVID